MTAPLPPLPVKKLATQCGISIGSSDGSPYPTEEQLRKFGERCAKLAVREALERAQKECSAVGREHPAHWNANVRDVCSWCRQAIRAMIEEYR